MTNTKIFGIGLPRTGTTSLASALRILGYRGSNYCMLKDEGSTDTNIKQKNSFQVNNSYYDIYQELYNEDEASKFILTIRDRDSWKASISALSSKGFQTWLGTAVFPWRQDTKDYRTILPDITEYNQEVMKVFNDRGALSQLLVVDLFDVGCDCSCKWKNICDFLGIKSKITLGGRILDRHESLGDFPHLDPFVNKV